MPASPLPTPDSALPPVPTAPADTAAPSAPPSVAPATPDIADDGDLIEKEWVMKVKHVISATAHDPYEQNKQFSQLKADYMQKRYGKTIKSED